MRLRPMRLNFAAVSLIICILSGFCAYFAGYRINFTASVPLGIWKLDGKELNCGGFVLVKPNDEVWYKLAANRGYFHESVPMLKKIAGMEGDLISYDVETRAVTINGTGIPATEILSCDTEGRPLLCAVFPVTLRYGEAWLTSENMRGYDSRYFGAVSTDLLESMQLKLRF